TAVRPSPTCGGTMTRFGVSLINLAQKRHGDDKLGQQWWRTLRPTTAPLQCHYLPPLNTPIVAPSLPASFPPRARVFASIIPRNNQCLREIAPCRNSSRSLPFLPGSPTLSASSWSTPPRRNQTLGNYAPGFGRGWTLTRHRRCCLTGTSRGGQRARQFHDGQGMGAVRFS